MVRSLTRAAALCLLLVTACDGDRSAPTGDLALAEAGVDLSFGDRGMDGAALDGAQVDAPAPPDSGRPDTVEPTTPFRLVLLPDTQYYASSSKRIAHFNAQTKWIVNQRAAQHLVFVTHVGDIVDHGSIGSANNKAEWDRADKAMKTLDGDLKANPDGVIPYGAAPGNHDYDVVYLKAGIAQFLKYFGPQRYKGRTWFVGASPNSQSMAQEFSDAGRRYLHLALEWKPSDKTLLWAQGLIAKRPTVPVIVSTHQLMGTGDPGKRSNSGDTTDSGGNNSGESLYRKLAVPFPQVFLMLCGHIHGDGRRVDKGPLGHSVLQVLADYQKDPSGGNGWMQLITFDAAAKKVGFKALSPTYKAGSTSGPDRTKSSKSNHSFTFDLAGHRAYLSNSTVLHWRQGQARGGGVYSGTRDTYLGNGKGGETKPGVAHGNAANVRTDGNADQEQGLLRFSGLVGIGKGQIPPKTKLKRAALTLTTEGSFADSKDGARLHRMTVAWTEAATWNSLKGGVTVGTQCEAKHDLDTKGKVSKKGTRTVDVTASVQAWVDGKPNHGWVLINKGGTDRWQFRSSEWGTVVERPLLTVVY